jgi:hypothetical protein
MKTNCRYDNEWSVGKDLEGIRRNRFEVNILAYGDTEKDMFLSVGNSHPTEFEMGLSRTQISRSMERGKLKCRRERKKERM